MPDTVTVNDLLRRGFQALASDSGAGKPVIAKDFRGQLQASDNWCWAAAAATVDHFHRTKRRETPFTQCDFVRLQVPMISTACNGWDPNLYPSEAGRPPNGVMIPPDMDKAGFLNLALEERKLLEVSLVLNSGKSHLTVLDSGQLLLIDDALDFDELKKLIHADRLICLRSVRDGRRHFYILYGYRTEPDADVLLWDPASGPDVVEFDLLSELYGPFTHKLVTRAPEDFERK